MNLQGLRVHIAGSAAVVADRSPLLAAHDLVRELVIRLVETGAGLVTGISDEPKGDANLALIFDWTVLETLANIADPAPCWPRGRGGRFRVVGSQRGLDRIPDRHVAIWSQCTKFKPVAEFSIECDF